MPAIQLMSVSTVETTTTSEVSGVKTQKLQGLQGTFSNYMQQNSSNTAQAAKQQNVVAQEKTNVSGSDDSQVQQQYEQYQNKSAAQAEKITNCTDDTNPDTEVVEEAVEEAVENIKEIIKENLGVDDEQLEAVMELLGLAQTDLLNPQQVIALSAALTGSENAEMMIFQEGFQTVMQEVTVVTEDLLKELGMTMEELTQQIQTEPESVQQEPVVLPDETATELPVEETGQINTQPVQETAVKETETGVPHQAVTVVQQEEVQETQPKQQETVQVQEVQQQEQGKTQQIQQQQQQEQPSQQEMPQKDTENPFVQQRETQENPRFEFHAGVQHQEQVFSPQTPQNVMTQQPLPQIHMQDVIDQIVEYTKVTLSEDVKSIEMQLNPENLGKVYLHVSEKQGTITAQLTAQNENLKEALVQQAAILKDTLNQQGIKVDAVEVSTGTHEFESNLERDAREQEEQARQQEEQARRTAGSRRSINLSDLNDLDGLSGLMSEEEALTAQIMRDNGNNVDYKA